MSAVISQNARLEAQLHEAIEANVKLATSIANGARIQQDTTLTPVATVVDPLALFMQVYYTVLYCTVLYVA